MLIAAWERKQARLKETFERDQRAASILDREQRLKEKQLYAREQQDARQEAADDSGQVEGAGDGEPLAAFEMPMDGSEEPPPTAMLERKDGETLFYDSKLNFLFGPPSSGKSWVALYCIHETLLRGRRAILWDHEDTVGTLTRRSKLLGEDLADYWRDGQFKYLRAGLDASALAMAEAMAWIAESDGPALVIIDSAESAGCPSDGADVAPWLVKTVLPFRDAGASVLVLDHVAKQKINRPLGPIGSQHKLARVDGAALFVSGVAWTDKADGHIVLSNHKDRHGMLPSPLGKAVARIIGTHEGGGLNLSIVAPEKNDNVEEAYIPTLRALLSAGPDGVLGQKAMRELVVGRASQRDKAIGDLADLGFILKRQPERSGQKVHYSITASGLEELEGNDDEA